VATAWAAAFASRALPVRPPSITLARDRARMTRPITTPPATVPTELRELNRQVTLMTAILWAAHVGVLATRSAALVRYVNLSHVLANSIVATIGFFLTMIIYLTIRHRVLAPRRRFILVLWLSIPACLFLTLCNELIWLALTDYFQTEFDFSPQDLFTSRITILLGSSVYTAVLFLWVFVAWCAIYVAAASTDDLRERDRKLAVAKSAANQAKLQSLRLQLSPHFLFNTLNTISGLIAVRDNSRAEELLLRLSSFLRQSLIDPAPSFVPLAEEIQAQKLYLDIEQHRFGDRLMVEYDIARDCADAVVPILILQPLVENAVKHGVAPTMQTSKLTLTARRDGQDLKLVVENTLDPAASRPSAPGFGIGLSNVRERLQELYGEAAELQSGAGANNWRSVIILPFKFGDFQ
jgi:two-component system LytT family sensor kinase